MNGRDMIEVEVYKKREEHWKGDRKKRREEKEREGRTLREESEQYYFLYKLSLLGSTCVELDTHLYIYIYIYKTETFEASTIFHVSIT